MRADRDTARHKRLLRLLRALARPGAIVVTAADGSGLRLAAVDGPAGRIDKPVDAGALEIGRARGLVERHGEGWRLAEAGRLALRRLLAGDDPFREQHQQRVRESRCIDGAQQPVTVNDAATPLGWLARRRDADGRPLISATQFAAGERLGADFAFAGLGQRITSNWSATGVPGGSRQPRAMAAELTDARLAARQRLRRALDFVGGDMADLLLDVCCLHTGLADVENERNWPRRSGKLILTLALDRLAEHYGMNCAGQSRYRARISHWGSQDYRPRIDPAGGGGDQGA